LITVLCLFVFACIDSGDPSSPHDPGGTRADVGALYFDQSGPSCIYVLGDANGSGNFNGLDVTYGVAYFKGGPPPPYSCDCPPHNTWFVAGDVNGSCSFNGLDVTYMVAYLKGGPPPQPCGDCPPARLLAPPAPGDEPIPAVKSITRPILIPEKSVKTAN
jgi:hypothetical protein